MPSLRKLSRREAWLVTARGGVIAVLTAWWLWPAGSLPLVGQRSGSGPEAPPIPRVDLARLDAPRPGGEAGRRNLFEFGSAPAPVAAPPPPVVVATPAPVVRP